MVIVVAVVMLVALAGVYLTIALGTAQWVYGIQRADQIDYIAVWYRAPDPVDVFNRHNRKAFRLRALVVGLIWPLAWPVMLTYMAAVRIVRAVELTERRSTYEIGLDHMTEEVEKIVK